MYMDAAVLAGIGTVGLMVAFFVGFAIFVWQDAKHKHGHSDKTPHH